MRQQIKHYSKLIFPFAVMILAVLLYLTNSHQFLISPDSYDILLTARSLAENGTIDVMHLEGYWVALAPFSRYGAAIVLSLLHSLSGIDFVVLAKGLSLLLFIGTWRSLLIWMVRKYPQKHSQILLVWALFVLSFAQLFWVQMVVSDMLAAALLAGGLVITDSGFKKRSKEDLLALTIGALVFVRWEIAILLLLISSVRGRYTILETARQIVPGLAVYALFIVATTDTTRFIDYHIQRLQDGILLSPLLLVLGLVLLLFVFLRFRNSLLQLSLGFLLLVPGVLFFEQHNILGTLQNGIFLVGHELPLFVMVIFAWYVARKEKFETVKLYIGLAGLMVFTYHFYFQHYTIILPLAFVAVVMSLQAAKLRARFEMLLPILIVVSLVILLFELPAQSPGTTDIYTRAFAVQTPLQMQACLEQRSIETSFLSELLFWEYDRKDSIALIGQTAVDATIVDREFALRNELSSNDFTRVEVSNALHIRGQGRFQPWLYVDCD